MEDNAVTLPLVHARKELAVLSGVALFDWNHRFECVTMLDKWPGEDLFPMFEARAQVGRLIQMMPGRGRVVLLGKRVASAFGVPWDFFEWNRVPWFQTGCAGSTCGVHTHDERCVETQVAVAPHPSRVNRWWNSPSNQLLAIKFWSEMCSS